MWWDVKSVEGEEGWGLLGSSPEYRAGSGAERSEVRWSGLRL